MLSQEAIKEFQNIYRLRFGKEINLAEAEAKGITLLRLYKTVLKTSDLKEKEYAQKDH